MFSFYLSDERRKRKSYRCAKASQRWAPLKLFFFTLSPAWRWLIKGGKNEAEQNLIPQLLRLIHIYIADFVGTGQYLSSNGHNYTGMKRCLLGICKKALVETVPGATLDPQALRHWQRTQTILSLKTERKVERTHTAGASLTWVQCFKHSASVWWGWWPSPRQHLCITEQ